MGSASGPRGELAGSGTPCRRAGRWRGLRRWGAVALLAFVAGPALPGAASAAREDGRLWVTAIGRAPLPRDFLAFLFVQSRFSQDIGEFERLVIRPWIAKPLGHGFVASLGYDAHIIRNPVDITEQRAWQELAFGHAFGKINTLQRARLEQRFIPGGGDVAWRFRLMTLAAIPIPIEKLRLIVSNEFFFDLNQTRAVPMAGFNENRIFGGLERPLGRGVSAQLGYLFQYVIRPRQDAANHTLFVGVTVFP